MLSYQNIDPDQVALAAVRETEKLRLAAIRINDTNVMEVILDEKCIYISARGQIFDKRTYIMAVRHRCL